MPVYKNYQEENEYFQKQYNDLLKAGIEQQKQKTGPFVPNVGQAWDTAQDALGAYYKGVQPSAPLTGLEDMLDQAGAYQGYDWKTPDYTSETYNPYQYSLPNAVAPDYQAGSFSAPGIDPLMEVQPVADNIWDAARARAREETMAGFTGARQNVQDELARTGRRPEQAAALLAKLALDEQKAQQLASLGIDTQQAQQAVGIAQQTQGLGATKALAAADLLKWQQEAQEQANMAEAQYGMGKAQWQAGMESDLQAKQAAEGKYGYEQKVSENRFNTGLDQWLQEQNQAEEQAKYQSEYALAQDKAAAKTNQWEANRAANVDYQNALLQGQQAATQQFSQAGTYSTNLKDGERKNMPQYEQPQQKQIVPTQANNTQYSGAMKTQQAKPAY